MMKIFLLLQLLEKENKILKEKLSSVKSELEDATIHMNKLAGDSSSLYHTVHEQQGKYNNSKNVPC